MTSNSTTAALSNVHKETYLGVGNPFPKQRIVFKSGQYLNLFGVVKVNLDGSWTRVWTRDGRCFMYDPASVDYIEINDGPAIPEGHTKVDAEVPTTKAPLYDPDTYADAYSSAGMLDAGVPRG